MYKPLLVLTSTVGLALAASFSGFDIRPKGDQRLDLSTGITTLTDGGTVTDAKSGVSIEASYIELKDGEFIKASKSTLKTKEGGVLKATTANYNAKTASLTASENLLYSDDNISNMKAESIQVDTKSKMVVAQGGVSVVKPEIKSNTLIADYDSNTAVLYGNYKYVSGSTKLSSSKENAVLFVKFDKNGKTSASTKPSAEQLAPFKPYLR